MIARALASATLVAILAVTSHHARADRPMFELGAKASYLSPPIRGGTTPFGAGFGGRFGFSLSGVYLGATVAAYLGGTDIDVTNKSLMYGVEGGYGVRFALSRSIAFTLRPQVGVGNVSITHADPTTTHVDVVTTASGRSGTTSRDSVTISNVYVEPALVAMFSTGSTFVAVTANMLVVPNVSYSGEPETWLSYGLSGQLGFLF